LFDAHAAADGAAHATTDSAADTATDSAADTATDGAADAAADTAAHASTRSSVQRQHSRDGTGRIGTLVCRRLVFDHAFQ
jgi:hypothetical protein